MKKHRWRKSSYSSVNGECVEVSDTLGAIRDSKNPAGPTLRLNGPAFTEFIRAVKAGQFDR